MLKKILWFFVAVVIVSLFSSPVLALDPIGAPVAEVGKGQYSIGIEYVDSQLDLTAENYTRDGTSYSDYDIKSAKVRKTYAKLTYGLTDNWNVFGRVGVSNIEFKSGTWDWVSSDYQMPFSGDDQLAWGFGTTVNFFEESDTVCGVLFQISWGSSEEDLPYEGSGDYEGDAEFDFYEMMLAAGPKHNLSDKVSIYGGPFVYFFSGDFEAGGDGYTWEFDAKESENFGGFLGGSFEISENASFNAEFQIAPYASAFAANFLWSLP